MRDMRIGYILVIIVFCILVSGWLVVHADQLKPITGNALTGKHYSWTSILPPLLAIIAALICRQVMLALFLGIWLGAFLAGDISLKNAVASFFTALTEYIVPAMSNKDHVSIIIFSLLIGGMIGIVSENGGMRGIVEVISRFIKNRKQGQLATSLMGFLIFFDDYSNTMIVGNAMRPLTDKLRITRAKLAYIVDSTAAPVATIALVSTWIGAMISYITDAKIFMANYSESAYMVFIQSLPYNFYAFFTIFFVIIISASGRDFGPMLTVRRELLRAQNEPELDRYDVYKSGNGNKVETKISHWSNAAIPILILIFGTLAGLWVTGHGNTVQQVIGSADSYAALLWASLLGLFIAGLITRYKKLLSTSQMLSGIRRGMHLMFDGLMILVLAWAISEVTKKLGTADFLVSALTDFINPFWIPVVIFILAGLISFATGSSWGTMGILMPLAIPLVWNTCNLQGLPIDISSKLIFGSVSAVLAGSVWGDHCSPISDTTILSSSASHCFHIEHVRTQLPYALTVGAVSVLAAIGVFILNMPIWIIYIFGILILLGIIFRFGVQLEAEDISE